MASQNPHRNHGLAITGSSLECTSSLPDPLIYFGLPVRKIISLVFSTFLTPISAWGFILGARDNRPEWTELGTMMAILFFSATLLHCAACVINDICDIDFDRQVGKFPVLERSVSSPSGSHRRRPTPERTKNRPLASGAVSVPAAWVFLLIQVGVFFWLLSYVNTTS